MTWTRNGFPGAVLLLVSVWDAGAYGKVVSPPASVCKLGEMSDIQPAKDERHALRIVRVSSRFSDLLTVVKYFRAKQRSSMAPLVDLLSNSASRTEIPLRQPEAEGVEVEPRVLLGEAQPVTEGVRIEDDLFILAGRANWLLSEVTCRRMGVVTVNTTHKRLAVFASMWREYLAGKDVGIKDGDARLHVLTKMSRQGVHNDICSLTMLLNLAARSKTMRRRGPGTATRDAQSLLEELALITGQDFGLDAAAWIDWYEASGPYLYFDWKEMRMRVWDAADGAFFIDEDPSEPFRPVREPERGSR